MSKQEPRETVAALFIKQKDGIPFIGTHWSSKAAQVEAENCTTVGGGVKKGETPWQAMLRELAEEYGEVVAARCQIWQLSMEPILSTGSSGEEKLYFWFLVICPADVQEPDCNSNEVHSFGWQPVQYIEPATLCCTPSKCDMILRAIDCAAKYHPDIIPSEHVPKAVVTA